MLPPNITFTAPVEIHAEAVRKGPPRFTSLAYSGGAMNIAGYHSPVVLDLAGLTARRGPQANLDHDQTKRVGNVDAVDNDGRRLVLSGPVSAASAAATEFLESAANGYQWQASVEVAPQQLEDVPRGDQVEANGRSFAGPVIIARRGVLHGVAFVAGGADDSTSVSIAARRKGRKMQADFETFLTSMVGDHSNLTAGQLATCHANYRGSDVVTSEDHAAVAPLIKASADPVANENRRLRQIDAACRERDGWGPHEAKVGELKAQAVEGALTVDELLDELRPIRGRLLEDTFGDAPPPVRGGRMLGGDGAQVVEAALCQSLGLQNLDKQYSDRVMQAAHDRYKGRVGLQQVLLQAAAENGYRVEAGTRISQGNLRDVLGHAFPPIHAAAFSSYSIATALSNVANKSVQQAWAEGDQTWREVAQVKPVSDFKAATTFRLLDDFEYQEIPPGGEFTHGSLSDEHYTRTAKCYGRMLTVPREDLINDDQSALADNPMRLGRAGLQKLNKVFWTAFLNNAAFFHTDHGNVSTGSPGSVLGSDGVGLTAAVLAFRKLLSPDGKGIDGEPAVLLVPPELEFIARKLFTSANFAVTGDTDAAMASGNPFQALYRPVVQRRLSDSSFTGYSASAWYLLRNPNIAAVVAMSFLDGIQTPTVETAAADFNTLGLSMRAFHDFGADRTVDYLAGIRSVGA